MPKVIPSNSEPVRKNPADMNEKEFSAELEKISPASTAIRQDARQVYKRAKAMMGAAIAFGFKRFMFYGAALHNIKTFELYKLDEETPTWTKFLNSINLDQSDSYRYLDIGSSIADRISHEKPGFYEDVMPLLQKDVEALADTNLEKLQDFSFRELVALSKRVDIFDSAMNGNELQKLLPGKKDTSEEDARRDMTKRSEIGEFNDHMRKTLEPYGWRWNAKEQRGEHEDGTPLIDEEYGQVTAPEAALHLWRGAEMVANQMTLRIRETILQEMKPFLRYNMAIKNDALRRQAGEIKERLAREFETVVAMLNALIDGDEKLVKDIHKKGIGE